MTAYNHDITRYVAVNDYGARIGLGETVVSSRQELIANIVRGELGFDNVIAVQSFNAFEGWATDATSDVLADVEAEKRRLQDLEDFPLGRVIVAHFGG